MDLEEKDFHKSSVKTTLPLPKPLQITIKLFDKLRGCETNGRETIVDMVKRKLKETDVQRKANMDFFFFKRKSDEAYLNIGAITGVLEEKEIYECIFKKKMEKKTTDMMRSYNADKFKKTWGIESFYVKLTDVTFSVSYFQKFKAIGKLLVDFFPGETLYEALYRDGRFKERTKDGLVIRSCDFLTPNDVEICLNFQASNHAHEVLKFKRRKTIKYDLPSEVSPQPEPPGHLVAVKMEPATPLKVNRGNTEFPSLPTQDPPSSAPAPKVPKILHTLEGLALYLKDKLGLEIIKQSDEYKEKTKQQVDEVKQTRRNNDRVFKKHYENFALHFNHSVFLSDLEETIRLKPSIGAIIANNISNVSVCAATCFRIGINYVITNNHVVDEINDLGINWRNCYVDFNYKEQGQPGHCFRFSPDPVFVSSEELDYAILELNPEGRNLPPSVVDPDSGFNIAPLDRQFQGGECLSFIGHPGGLGKQMDVSCPIKHKDEIEDHLALAIKTLDEQEFQEHRMEVLTAENNPNSAVYDVSTFFKGSSGSPGFLMKEKLLIVLHSRGIPYKGNRIFFAVEEGMLMASVVKDVMSKINVDDNDEQKSILGDIFGESTAKNFYPEEMDIDSE